MDVIPAERMPAALRAARVAMILQSGLGLLLLALLAPAAAAGASAPVFLAVLLPLLLAVVVLGWLVFSWSSRRKWVRWCAVAVEGITVGGVLVRDAVEGQLGGGKLIGAVLPLAIVVILLTPPAARWFDR
ncbi:hypothetical protein GCM10010149_42010 [Nonomuraea roseoviolacea subsp. roseoviolacea]|uniref:hypothetical protein n=1 Tax=Nonomuraea roseoviolacea TaxID=103837 RepID=UPI0031CF495E